MLLGPALALSPLGNDITFNRVKLITDYPLSYLHLVIIVRSAFFTTANRYMEFSLRSYEVVWPRQLIPIQPRNQRIVLQVKNMINIRISQQ